MSNVIKAIDQQTNRHGVAFNLDDIVARANDYLARVKVEAAKIVTEARKQAEEIRRGHEQLSTQEQEDAKRRGYEEGLRAAELEARQKFDQSVKDEARRQLRQQIETLLPALRQTVAYVADSKHVWYSQWEHATLRLVRAMAERVVRRELNGDPAISLHWIREALELAAGSAKLQIFLHPEDHEALRPEIELLVKELASVAQTEIIADASVSRGGCRVETPSGLIDQQMESQLARLEEELS